MWSLAIVKCSISCDIDKCVRYVVVQAVTAVAVSPVNNAPPATATTPKSNPVPVVSLLRNFIHYSAFKYECHVDGLH
jgi:hypothetical protein